MLSTVCNKSFGLILLNAIITTTLVVAFQDLRCEENTFANEVKRQFSCTQNGV